MSQRAMTPRSRAPNRCSSSGSTPSTRATSPRPDARPGNGPRRSPDSTAAEARSRNARPRSPRSTTGYVAMPILTEQVAELVATAARRRPSARRRRRPPPTRSPTLIRQAREAKLVADAAAATSSSLRPPPTPGGCGCSPKSTRAHATIADVEAEAQEAADAADGGARRRRGCPAAVAGPCAQSCNAMPNPRGHRHQIASATSSTGLTARLAKIDTIQRDRDRIGAELSAIMLTDELHAAHRKAAAAVDRTSDQLALISAAVELTAAADIELAVGDQRVSLPAGQSWSTTVTGATEVEVPGVVTARIIPGAATLDVQAKHVAAQEELAAALAAGEVADLAAARPATSAAANCSSSRDQLAATLDGLCGDEADRPIARTTRAAARGQPAEADLDGHRRAEPNSRPRHRSAPRPKRGAAAAHADSRCRDIHPGNGFAERSGDSASSSSTRPPQRLAQERTSVADADLASAAEAAAAGPAARAPRRRAGRRAGRRGTGRGGRRTGRSQPRRPSRCATATKRPPGAARNHHRAVGLRHRGPPGQARCRRDRT